MANPHKSRLGRGLGAIISGGTRPAAKQPDDLKSQISDFRFTLPAAGSNDVTYERLPDGQVGGQAVAITEVKPRAQGAPYSKVVVYVSKEYLMPIKAEFFDPVGAQLKVLSVKKLKRLKSADGSRVVPLETEMRNLQKGSTTVLSLDDVDLQTPQNASEFTPQSLEQ